MYFFVLFEHIEIGWTAEREMMTDTKDCIGRQLRG